MSVIPLKEGSHDARSPDRTDGKRLKTVVARDGIEPPTPAFSGLRSTD